MINYGVIGCGVISKVHCAAIEKEINSKLITVCDIVPEKANDLAKTYGCNAVYDYDEVLKDPNIDVITICLPHHEHYKLFKKSLSAGKHVLTEKPLGINFNDVSDMVKISEATELKTTVAFQHRHSILVKALKTYLDSGLFGDIKGGELEFHCTRDMDYYDSDEWRGKWATEGGGTLINQAIHTVDLANLFLGCPLNVEGSIENRQHPKIEVEDYAQGSVIYKNSLLMLKAVNSNEKPWEPKLTINCLKGKFVLIGSDHLHSLELYDSNETEIIKKLTDIENEMKQKEVSGKACYGSLHNLVFEDFTNSIINNTKPLMSIKEGAMANNIVLEFYKNRRGNL